MPDEPGAATPSRTAPLSRTAILILAVACGVGVADVYFPQAISPLIATGLHTSTSSAALVVTATQIGYATGIFFLVPLGDRVQPRRLIVTLLALTAVGLLAAGLAPTLQVLTALSVVIGATTVVPQLILPMAAGHVPAERRGAVTGTLLSGLIGGILLARTFSGTLGQWLGWRAPYLTASALVLILAAVLMVVIPATTPPSRQRYPALVTASLQLFRTEPDLRRSCFYQATVFAGFSAAWTAVALLVTGPTYRLGATTVGLIALVGAGSMVATPMAGRRIDREGPDRVNLLCMLGTIVAAAVLLGATVGGAVGMLALVVGILLLDVCMQSGQVANLARILALRPEARSRLNTAYMTCAFLGSSAGSWLGVRAYTAYKWPGVCALVATTAGLALTRHLAHLNSVRRQQNRAIPAGRPTTPALATAPTDKAEMAATSE